MATLSHDNLKDPVQAHLNGDFTLLSAEQSVAQALEGLRASAVSERIVYFYVADGEGRLVGVVPTRRLLMSPTDRRISEIMEKRVVSIPADASVLEACELFVTRRLLAFPVVDARRRLLGVIDVSLFTDEVLGLSRQQLDQDVFQLIGINILEGRRASAWTSFRRRFPWLLCNIAGGTACALLAGRYEAFLGAKVVIALFIPLVLAVAESVSIQSMTLTLQGMHGGNRSLRGLWRPLRREFATAMLLAAGCGGSVALAAWIWKRDPWVAAAVGGSIGFSIMTACLLGVALPAVVRTLRGDPKIAAGPVVLALADIVTLLFYFNLSGFLLR